MILPKGRIPHGGWNFPVAEGVKLTAPTQEKLLVLISEYRIRNNIPPSDAERDLNDYYCRNWPDGCVKESHELGGNRRDFPRSESPANRVARWAMGLLHRMPQGGYPLVGQPEADARAKICRHCPKNSNWRGQCGSCTQSAVTLLAQVRRVSRTGYDGSLMACSVTGYELTTSIWLQAQESPVTQEQRDAMPANCWRKAV
jgi:hypothetical protein